MKYTRNMTKKLFLILFLLLVPISFAQKNSIKLLAVNDATKNGTVVDLELNVIDGSGKVFIETYPLSQLDTQISLRIGKTIACKTTNIYCLNKDFIYSLKTNSPVVAGPSAGAAITIVTLASLEDQKLDPNTVITGTINSGGVVGAVGSLKEKIIAAEQFGLKKILIPKGELNSTKVTEYEKKYNITVLEVADIDEAYEIFTNKEISRSQLTVNKQYQEIMKEVSINMCERADSLRKELDKYELSNNSKKINEASINLSKKAKISFEKEEFYASASRCFGANVYLREALLRENNFSKQDIEKERENVKEKLILLEKELNSTKVDNLGTLEAAMIIRERIFDAKNNLNEKNSTNKLRDLSYAIERTYSAESWKEFIKFQGKLIDESKLQESCVLKLEEVEELYNYISLYVPSLLKETKKSLDEAKAYLNTKDYALCLFKASKTEAEINTALGTIYIGESSIKPLLQNKIFAAEKAIEKQIQKGNFPVLGYSYYEYSKVLNESETYSALLYAEYGIELSNLDIYFPTKKPLPFRLNEKALTTLVFGFIIGVLLVLIRKQYRRKKIVLRRKH